MATQQYNFNLSPTQKSNTIIILNSGRWVDVPAGADPDAFRRFAQAKEDRELNPKKAKKQTYRRQDNGNRRNRRARMVFTGHIIGEATARRMDELKAEAETDDQIFTSGLNWDGDIETELAYDLPFMGEPVVYEDGE